MSGNESLALIHTNRDILKYSLFAQAGCWAAIFLIESYAMIEYFVFKKGMKQGTPSKMQRSEKLIKLHQYGVTFFTLLAALFIFSFILTPPGYYNSSVCRSLGTMPPVIYCFSVQTLYSFFLIKVDLVSGFERAVWYNRLLSFIRVVVYVFVPLLLLPLVAITFYGYLDETTGYCHQITRQIVANSVFLVGNIGISACMVILFVEPLRQNAKVLENGGNGMKDSMLKIVRRNVVLSCIAVGTSALVSLSYLVTVSLDPNQDKTYLYDISLLLAYIDLSINGICAKLMTALWIPLKARQWMFESSTSTHSKVQDVKSNNLRAEANGNENNRQIVAASPEQSTSQVISSPRSQEHDIA